MQLFIGNLDEMDGLLDQLHQSAQTSYALIFCQRYGEARANQKVALRYAKRKWGLSNEDLYELEQEYEVWLLPWDELQAELKCQVWLECFYQHHEINSMLDPDYPNERLLFQGPPGGRELLRNDPLNRDDCASDG